MRIDLQQSDISVYIDDQLAGTTIVDTIIGIPAKDTFSVPVKVAIDMKNILRNALTIFTNEKVNIKLVGTATLKKSNMTFRVPISYSGEQKLF
jgi:hypothetical protein